MTDMDNGFQIWECVNTLVDDLSIANTSGASDSPLKDHYGIAIYSSANTIISRVLGECGNSAIDMGGHTPNINTYIKNCNLFATFRASGIGMHENAYNTVVEDCVVGGMTAYGTMFVNRCRFVQRNRVQDSNTAITYRGSHNAEWAQLSLSDCIIEGSNLQIAIAKPVPDDPVQAYDNVVGLVNIQSCVGGTFAYAPTTDSTILSNTINRLVLDNWRDCKEVYHSSAVIDDLVIRDCTFTEQYVINDHNQAHGVYLDGIHSLDYTNSIPQMHKIHKDATVRADNVALPEGVTITLASNSQSAKFRLCGINITPNDADDYIVGTVTGNSGSALIRSAYPTRATISIDGNGNVVHTQANGTSANAFYPVGMVYVPETSTAAISAKIKNTGQTNGATFRPYIAIVSCDTGLVTYRDSGTGGTADSTGVTISQTRIVPANSVVLLYFYCSTAVANAVTTFEELSMTVTPSFIPPVVNEPYTAKRRTGDGTLTSLPGVNNIMCSEDTFSVKYGADLTSNPVGLLPRASGVSF